MDRHVQDPYFVVGLATPDLWKGFSKVFNQQIRHAEPWEGGIECLSLESGIFRHFKGDRLFHNAEFFKKEQAFMRKSISEIIQPGKHEKVTFLGHVLFEIMLDRKIMERLPACLERYYDILETADEQVLLEYIRIRRLPDAEGRFFEYFCRFTEQRFLYNYRSPEGVIQSLNRIYHLATGAKLPEKHEGELMALIPKLDRHLEDKWLGYFDWMQEKMGDAV